MNENLKPSDIAVIRSEASEIIGRTKQVMSSTSSEEFSAHMTALEEVISALESIIHHYETLEGEAKNGKGLFKIVKKEAERHFNQAKRRRNDIIYGRPD